MKLTGPLATAILTLTVAAGCDSLDRPTAPAPDDGVLAARVAQPQSMLTSDACLRARGPHTPAA
jgi:hypothetical protein